VVSPFTDHIVFEMLRQLFTPRSLNGVHAYIHHKSSFLRSLTLPKKRQNRGLETGPWAAAHHWSQPPIRAMSKGVDDSWWYDYYFQQITRMLLKESQEQRLTCRRT
jgi:hypothetical protein